MDSMPCDAGLTILDMLAAAVNPKNTSCYDVMVEQACFVSYTGRASRPATLLRFLLQGDKFSTTYVFAIALLQFPGGSTGT